MFQLRKRRGLIREWEGGREGWGWLVSQDSGEEECLVRGSVVVVGGQGEEVDWQNIVGQTVDYCCKKQKKGTVATRVWLGGKEEGEQTEAAETKLDAEQFDGSWKQAVEGKELSRKQSIQARVTSIETEKAVQSKVTSWTQAVKGREISREQVVQSRLASMEQVVQGKVTHWVPEQQAGVIQTDEGEVIVSR